MRVAHSSEKGDIAALPGLFRLFRRTTVRSTWVNYVTPGLHLVLQTRPSLPPPNLPVVPIPIGSPDHIDLKTLRVAVYTDNCKMTPTKETIEAVNAAFNALSDAGTSVNEDMPSAFEHMGDLPNSVSGADGRAGTKRLLERAGTTESIPPFKAIDNAAPVSAKNSQPRSNTSRRNDRFHGRDIIVAPVQLPFGMTLDDDHKEEMTYCRPYI